MGIIDAIKQDAQKSGQNRGKFIFIKDGQKKRIRFLQEFDKGFAILFHDSYEAGINVPCQEVFGRECPYCGQDLRDRKQYAWSVWDVEDKEVKILMYPMNNCSPVGSFMAMYENYGTIMDRDYVVSVTGKQQNKQFNVIPMDKEKFRNSKAKAFSESAFLDILDKAYPDENGSKYNKKGESKNDDSDEELDYSEMSARELYNLCEDRGIEAEPKMKQKYYIDLLEEYDENNSSDDDWDEDEDDGKEESKYAGKSAKELFKLCKERDIECEPKKPEKYYINLLEENDKAHDDWEDSDDEDEDDDWDE